MTQSCGNTFASAVVQSHHSAVAQRQLQASLTLLAGYLTGHGAVHLVCEPVLTSYGLELQYVAYVLVEFLRLLCHVAIVGVCIVAFHSLVLHYSLGRVAEHLCHIEVERTHSVALYE